MKIGTVEPKYTDVVTSANKERTLPGNDGRQIMDEALAFIYGAIAKYAWRPTYLKNEEYRNSLKEYILKEAQHIGEELFEYKEEPSEDF